MFLVRPQAEFLQIDIPEQLDRQFRFVCNDDSLPTTIKNSRQLYSYSEVTVEVLTCNAVYCLITSFLSLNYLTLLFLFYDFFFFYYYFSLNINRVFMLELIPQTTFRVMNYFNPMCSTPQWIYLDIVNVKDKKRSLFKLCWEAFFLLNSLLEIFVHIVMQIQGVYCVTFHNSLLSRSKRPVDSRIFRRQKSYLT